MKNKDNEDMISENFLLKIIYMEINKGTKIQNCNSTGIVHNEPFITPTPKSLNSSGFQKVKKEACDNSQRIPLNEKANLYLPKTINNKKRYNRSRPESRKILKNLEIQYFLN